MLPAATHCREVCLAASRTYVRDLPPGIARDMSVNIAMEVEYNVSMPADSARRRTAGK
jgi:hypothetical protein